MINPSKKQLSNHERVWVVAACFNEQGVICDFIDQVVSLPGVKRLVLVDDGSSDDSVKEIRSWQNFSKGRNDIAQLNLIELTRNFGKEAAMLAGLDHAKGRCDAVVLIDSD